MKSIGIGDEAHGKLKRYCDRNKLGLGEFISASLVYFEKHGINPATHESPAEEMLKVMKKLDQVIAFIRKQEQDLLRPMVQAVGLSENRISNSMQGIDKGLQAMATSQELKDLNQVYLQVLQKLQDMFFKSTQEENKKGREVIEGLLLKQQQKQLEALNEIARVLDKKDKEGLGATLTKIFNKP